MLHLKYRHFVGDYDVPGRQAMTIDDAATILREGISDDPDNLAPSNRGHRRHVR